MGLFEDAVRVDKKFKVSVYGAAGSGKTTFALSFPGVGVVDMERGTDWYAGRESRSGVKINPNFKVKHTGSAKDVIDLIDGLNDQFKKGNRPIETLVIDPVTMFWDAIQDAFLERLKKKSKDNDAKIQLWHWKEIRAPYRRAITKLLNMPIHFVLVGRESNVFEKDDKGELIVAGTKLAGEKDTPYTSDIHLHFFTRPHPETSENTFFVRVEKDRTGLLAEGSVVKDFSYHKLKELADGDFSNVELPEEGPDDMRYEDVDNISERDSEIFADKSDPVSDLLNDEKIVMMRNRLGWMPGKVKALIEKHDITRVEDIGKLLADEIRKGNKKKASKEEPKATEGKEEPQVDEISDNEVPLEPGQK